MPHIPHAKCFDMSLKDFDAMHLEPELGAGQKLFSRLSGWFLFDLPRSGKVPFMIWKNGKKTCSSERTRSEIRIALPFHVFLDTYASRMTFFFILFGRRTQEKAARRRLASSIFRSFEGHFGVHEAFYTAGVDWEGRAKKPRCFPVISSVSFSAFVIKKVVVRRSRRREKGE